VVGVQHICILDH
jgi:hypothetical protein